MVRNTKKQHILYWEDVGERAVYAEQDDYAWKLSERIFGYRKESSIYIYHHGRLAAYYSSNDSETESNVGYIYYSQLKNCRKVIKFKRSIAEEVIRVRKKHGHIKLASQSQRELHQLLLKYLQLFQKALSIHYLTQPQFFEKFEKHGSKTKYKSILQELSRARFKYSRPAWTQAMELSKNVISYYVRYFDLEISELESAFFHEIKKETFNRKSLRQRVDKFVIISDHHSLRIYTSNKADELIKKYEWFTKRNIVKGVSGRHGYKKAKAFVIKNENLDLEHLPVGMRKGMVLVVQNAWPEFAVYYPLASAIVTNEGGVASHGAVVAREFGIPCIVGTRVATKIFKTGDKVEVDADKGIVRKLSGK
ncbi:MAG: PEP-utilizing enzyme [Patescibacteria group bacterium]